MTPVVAITATIVELEVASSETRQTNFSALNIRRCVGPIMRVSIVPAGGLALEWC